MSIAIEDDSTQRLTIVIACVTVDLILIYVDVDVYVYVVRSCGYWYAIFVSCPFTFTVDHSGQGSYHGHQKVAQFGCLFPPTAITTMVETHLHLGNTNHNDFHEDGVEVVWEEKSRWYFASSTISDSSGSTAGSFGFATPTP
jgi:hypothetical protein